MEGNIPCTKSEAKFQQYGAFRFSSAWAATNPFSSRNPLSRRLGRVQNKIITPLLSSVPAATHNISPLCGGLSAPPRRANTSSGDRRPSVDSSGGEPARQWPRVEPPRPAAAATAGPGGSRSGGTSWAAGAARPAESAGGLWDGVECSANRATSWRANWRPQLQMDCLCSGQSRRGVFWRGGRGRRSSAAFCPEWGGRRRPSARTRRAALRVEQRNRTRTRSAGGRVAFNATFGSRSHKTCCYWRFKEAACFFLSLVCCCKSLEPNLGPLRNTFQTLSVFVRPQTACWRISPLSLRCKSVIQ